MTFAPLRGSSTATATLPPLRLSPPAAYLSEAAAGKKMQQKVKVICFAWDLLINSDKRPRGSRDHISHGGSQKCHQAQRLDACCVFLPNSCNGHEKKKRETLCQNSPVVFLPHQHQIYQFFLHSETTFSSPQTEMHHGIGRMLTIKQYQQCYIK